MEETGEENIQRVATSEEAGHFWEIIQWADDGGIACLVGEPKESFLGRERDEREGRGGGPFLGNNSVGQ